MERSFFQHQKRATVGGAISGVFGGAVMSLLLVGRALLRDHDGWVHLKTAAYPYLGNSVFQAGFAPLPVIVGISVHLMIAVAWGFAFGVIFYGLSRVPTLGAGLGLGAISFLVMRFLVLPLFGVSEAVAGISFVEGLALHIIFGFFTSLAFLPAQTQLSQDELARIVQKARDAERSGSLSAPR
jgi:hypothetical protein